MRGARRPILGVLGTLVVIAGLASIASAAEPTRCALARSASTVAAGVTVNTTSGAQVEHGGAIEIGWRLPNAQLSAAHAYLIGAMPDTVRFEGNYQLDQDGLLAGGPGFLALPAKARAPYGIAIATDKTRVIIPIDDATVPRSGSLRVKPYVAGPLSIAWSVVVIDPPCKSATSGSDVKAIKTMGPFAVAPGTPEIVVQDFVTPDPLLELAEPNGTQRLSEVEISQDGRYRLEIFPRRYRVFDRASGAKVVDRSGVKPRFSLTGRFLLASVGDADKVYPTNFDVIDLVARKIVGQAGGPIVGWSNGDALMLDAGRAYQSVTFVAPLIDPVMGTEGRPVNWHTFFPGCGTCDAWVSSNIHIDWDQLAVLRADVGTARAMSVVNLASGRKAETTSFGDDEAAPLEQELSRVYGRADVPVARGWTSDAALALTHVGRGYSGYVDDEDSLQPAEADQQRQLDFVAPRRLALANGQVLLAQDLRPSGPVRGDVERSGTTRGRSILTEGSVDAELATFGLKLQPARAVDELTIPVVELPTGNDPLVRVWPADLKSEVLTVRPASSEWFKDEEFPDIVVAGWRLTVDGVRYLLLQHGSPAMTANGAHDLSFDLLTLDGAQRGTLLKLADISGLFSQFVGRDHTVARVSVLSGARLVVAVPGSGRAVVATLSGTPTVKPFDLIEPTLLCGFHEAVQRSLIVQSNCDGQLFVFEPNKQPTTSLAGRVVDNELILYTAQGFYASTYEGAHFVHVTFPGLDGVHSFEQFSKVLDRPDVIKRIISGEQVDEGPPAISPPPVVEATMRGGREALEISAKAQSGSGLATIDLFEDGRFVKRETVRGSTSSVTFNRTVPAHVRGLSVVATDLKGFRSRPLPLSLPVGDTASDNTLRVIAIGVDAYDKLEPLAGARIDAEKLVSELKANAGYYRSVETTIRVDRAAAPEIVMRDVETAVASAGPNDTVLFFFAGHGGRTDDGRYFMAVPTTDPDRLPETAIDWQQAARVLGASKGRVIAIIDACHSGQTAVAPVPNDGAVSSLTKSADAPMVVLAASKGRQLSEEAPDGAGGVFTQTLAKLIGSMRKATDSNGDGVLQISEVYRNLRQHVDAATAARQTPWLVRRNIVGDVPLF